MGGTLPSSDRELKTLSIKFGNFSESQFPDVEAGGDQDSLRHVVEAELELGPGDCEADEGPEDDRGLEHEAARHAAQHHPGLGEPGHEVKQTRPAAEDGDEHDDEGGDPRHVLQLRPRAPRPPRGPGRYLAVVLDQQHTVNTRYKVATINYIQPPQHQNRTLPCQNNDGELDLLEPDLPPVILDTLPDVVPVLLVLVSPRL